MTKKIRVALIGAGDIFKSHVQGFLKAGDRCEIAAVVKTHPERADNVRALLGNVRIERDYRSVLPDVDAVDILLPHDLHVEATLAAARAGKPVLIEKVMARNVKECDRMIAACRKAGVSLTVCHDRRYDPDWMALKKVVDSGALGRIHHWRLEHNNDLDLPPGHWIRSAERLGGGAVMSCLTHQIDGLRWFAGEVDDVSCVTQVIPSRMEGETIGVIAARLRSGATAQLSINWATRADMWGEVNQVTAERGEAYCMWGRGANLMLRENPAACADLFEGPPPAPGVFGKVKPAGPWTGHERCIDQWLRLLAGEPSEITTTGEDSRRTVEVAQAAGLAAARRRVVKLPHYKG